MEAEGTVSLWMGTATSKEALDRALQVSFSDDGDFLGSPWSRVFRIDYHDERQRQSAFRATPSRDLAELLAGASFAERIVDRFRALAPPPWPFNAVVLLYDYDHGEPIAWTGDGVSLRYFGSVSYRP